MADHVITYRVVVKEIAQKYGVYATFMPKPLFGQNGSGMHIHQSLFKGTVNAFFNSQDKWHLSKVAKRYIAGLLRHAPEFTLVTNQWVNSYKRLIPGYEAPIYLSWALRNRSDLIRVPLYNPGKETATRVELRSPDPACNPYLAFAVTLSAGLEGIEKQYERLLRGSRGHVINRLSIGVLKVATHREETPPERGADAFLTLREGFQQAANAALARAAATPERDRLCDFWRALGTRVVVRHPAEHDVVVLRPGEVLQGRAERFFGHDAEVDLHPSGEPDRHLRVAA